MSIVGRAYVTVRAVTSGVEKDIQSGMDKALNRVKVDGSSSKVGKKIDKGVGKSLSDGDGISTGINKQLKKVASSSGGDDGGKKIGRKLGKDIGDSAGKEAGGILAKVLKSPISPALLNQTGTLISSTAAAAISLTSTLGPTLAAGAGVGANALFGLGAALSVLKIGFKKTPELDKFKSSLGSSNAEMDRITKTVQGKLLPVLSKSINQITASLGPTLEKGLGRTAVAVGGITTRFANLSSTPLFQGRLATLFKNNASALRLFGKAGVTSVGALTGLAAAASPLAVRFGKFADKLATTASNAIDAGEASGGLDRFFQRAGDTTAKWGGILGTTGKALFNVFNAGSATGGIFLGKLDQVVTKFDTWTSSIEGQKSLQEFFAQSIPVMHSVGGLIAGLAKTFSGLSGGAGGVTATLDFLSQRVLPAVDAGLRVIVPLSSQLLVAFENLSPVLTVATGVLGVAADLIGALPGPLQTLTAGVLLFAVAGGKVGKQIDRARTGVSRFGSSLTANGAKVRKFSSDLRVLATTASRSKDKMYQVDAAGRRVGSSLSRAGKGAAVVGILALSSSDKFSKLTGNLGLGTAASVGLGASLLGLGAKASIALAGVTALFTEINSFKSASSDAIRVQDQVTAALQSGDTAAKEAARSAIQLQVANLATGNSFKDNAERILIGKDGAKKLGVEYQALTNSINADKYANQQLVPYIDATGRATDIATGSTISFSNALKQVAGNLSSTEAYIAYRQAVADTNKALSENGRTLDLNSQKGRDNADKFTNQADAILRYANTLPQGSAAQNKFIANAIPGFNKLIGSVDKNSVVAKRLKRDLAELSRLRVQPKLDADNKPLSAKTAEAMTLLSNINQYTAKPKVEPDPSLDNSIRSLLTANNLLSKLNRTVTSRVNTVYNNPNKRPLDPNNTRNGGWTSGRAVGGWAVGPGSPTSDSIAYGNTMISNREFVVRADRAEQNAHLLESINSGSYRGGASGNVSVVVNNPVPERASQSVNSVLKHKIVEAGWTS